MEDHFRSGLITIIGRPNVGKSTLLNRLVGQKVSITSRRPQTTRHRIMGVANKPTAQLVYVDTPGLHLGKGKMINRFMNRAATGALQGVDCIAMVITAKGWQEADERVLEAVSRQEQPVVLVINKMDLLKRREDLLPLLEQSKMRMEFAEIIPVSATDGTNMEQLEKVLTKLLPEQPPLFPEDQLTDRSERFMAAEFVREQIFRSLGQEVPYSVAVEIERFKKEKKILHINALIWVEKSGQKAILIGKGGDRLKQIGTAARKEMEVFFGSKVNLVLWVKVREGWSDSEKAVRSLGYADED
ncbi:MAG: GTPase Era [Acidiferrobacterales bacterium]|jgi:GTP-binding protein Era|nr:GTPase Era [Acidiferrobacterales bacterium]